jgi:hypothetical protein
MPRLRTTDDEEHKITTSQLRGDDPEQVKRNYQAAKLALGSDRTRQIVPNGDGTFSIVNKPRGILG